MKPLKICIDARLVSGMWGGVEQVVIGLAKGFAQLTDGDEQYLFFSFSDENAWLSPHVQGPCRLIDGPRIPWELRLLRNRRLKPALPLLREIWYRLPASANTGGMPRSDGSVEKLGADLMHFTIQEAFLTDVPSIYHPHDLQHLHLPQFFTAAQRSHRERRYRFHCARASLVAVSSSWTKRDLRTHYDLPDEKVAVIPWAPVTSEAAPSAPDLAAAREKFSLPERFAFYAAQTWPHKNHLGLLAALALLRDRSGLKIHLVSSGQQNEFYPQICARVRELGLEDSVHFLGFVSPLDLRCLYALARAVVIPTKFEAASFPMWEAFLAGIPVACSNVTSLPEQAKDAALLFDPDDPSAMASALERLFRDDALCRQLVTRGQANVAGFTWLKTARTFRAHYRRITRRPLSDEDVDLLAAAPAL